MANLIKLPTFEDKRGKLTVIEQCLPFNIQRVFFIHDINENRGGHGHKYSKLALVALNGSIKIQVQTPKENLSFTLSNPSECLILEPEDWHLVEAPHSTVTLAAFSSHTYDKNDYFYEKYR